MTLRWVEGIPAVRSLSGSKNEDSCLTVGVGSGPPEAEPEAPNSDVVDDEGPKCIFLLGGERPKLAAASKWRRDAWQKNEWMNEFYLETEHRLHSWIAHESLIRRLFFQRGPFDCCLLEFFVICWHFFLIQKIWFKKMKYGDEIRAKGLILRLPAILFIILFIIDNHAWLGQACLSKPT